MTSHPGRRGRWLGLVGLLALVGSLASSPPLAAEADQQPTDVDSSTRVVVETSSGIGTARREALADAVGGSVVEVVDGSRFVVEVEPGAAEGAARTLDDDPSVAAVAPRGMVEMAEVPDDPCYGSCVVGGSSVDQSELRQVDAEGAWSVTTGSPSVRVAVIDTRIDEAHPDLAGQVTQGPTRVTYPSTCSAGQQAAARGHGTSVAGLIAARTDNSVGIAGLGWQTQVVGITVLDDCGRGNTGDLAWALDWATSAGIDVVNLSLTGDYDQRIHDAVAAARAAGVVVVAAAGNSASDEPAYPAADDGVIGVTSVNGADQLSSWANRGSWVDLAAPGESVLTTVPTSVVPEGYQAKSGTSFAAPLVAATAALVVARHPDWSPDQIADQLRRGADQIVGTGSSFAWGRLDAASTVAGPPGGYWLVAADGGVFTFGDAAFLGADTAATSPVVNAAGVPSGAGYWTLQADGTVSAHGSAPALGSPTGARAPAVGMASTLIGDGYWVVGADGGIFAYGDAQFFGSTGSITLNRPIVGMAATPSGQGYWLVASDGGIFAYGDAQFFGSTGSMVLNRPIVGMAATPTGAGYWLVASDGGIFAYGDAQFLGSTGSIALNQPIVAMVSGG